MQKLRLFVFYCFLVMLFANAASAAENGKIRIAAGSLLEGYYSIGMKVCHYISKSNGGIPCEVVPTTGSLENLWLLQRGKVDLAFTLSNLALDSNSGKGYFATTKPFKDMYQVLRLHDEVFTVIVKDDDKILTFGDLEGRKISNGPPRSDSSITYKALVAYYDFKKSPIDVELTHEDYANEFCKGNIDAVMMMTGHPSALVNFITHACESDFATIDSEKMKLLLKNNPGFHKFVLPAGEYPGITQDQDSVAVQAILVSANHVDDKIIQNFLDFFPKVVNRFKSSHPALYNLDKEHFTNGFILPALKVEKIDNK